MNIQLLFAVIAIVLAALSYVWPQLLGVAVIILAASHFVPGIR